MYTSELCSVCSVLETQMLYIDQAAEIFF